MLGGRSCSGRVPTLAGRWSGRALGAAAAWPGRGLGEEGADRRRLRRAGPVPFPDRSRSGTRSPLQDCVAPQTAGARASSLAGEVLPSAKTSPLQTAGGDEGRSARHTIASAALMPITREQQPYSPIQNIMALVVHRNAPPEPLCEVAVSSRLTRCGAGYHSHKSAAPDRPQLLGLTS